LLHSVGDRKTVDCIEAGVPYFLQAGFAVMRVDVSNHGPRKVQDFDYSFTGETKYRSRDVITQTVFDLQRAVDFLETRPEIDAERIGYYGISLGGMIGTVFCAIDTRVDAVVIALAGGGLHFMYGLDAVSTEVRDYLSIIDPINFVGDISPRPLLMINAEEDEVVPPVMSKLMYSRAAEPKEIIWYPTRHRALPVDKAYPDGVRWFEEYLK
jgi:cephalosporin-C deacetylase-like acetyl esterase